MFAAEIKRLNGLNPLRQYAVVEHPGGKNLVQTLTRPNNVEETSTLIFNVTPETFIAFFGIDSLENPNSTEPVKATAKQKKPSKGETE